jgi:hypothetical protein
MSRNFILVVELHGPAEVVDFPFTVSRFAREFL